MIVIVGIKLVIFLTNDMELKLHRNKKIVIVEIQVIIC